MREEVEGEEIAQPLDNGKIQVEFAYRNGNDVFLKGKPDTFSTTYG
jgi:hypothetical protein